MTDFDRIGSACIVHHASGRVLHAGSEGEGWPHLTLRADNDSRPWLCSAPSTCVPAPGVASRAAFEEHLRRGVASRAAFEEHVAEGGGECNTQRFAILDGHLRTMARLEQCVRFDSRSGRAASVDCAAVAQDGAWAFDAGSGEISTTHAHTRWCLARDPHRARFLVLDARRLLEAAAQRHARCAATTASDTAPLHASLLSTALAPRAIGGVPVLLLALVPDAAAGSGARCLDRFGARFPIHTDARTEAGFDELAFVCTRWVFDHAAGTLVASVAGGAARLATLCLTRLALQHGEEDQDTVVRAQLCLARSAAGARAQQWEMGDGNSAARALGTLRARVEHTDDPGSSSRYCLTLPPMCQSTVSSAGTMAPCAAAQRLWGARGRVWHGAPEQTWLALRPDDVARGTPLGVLVREHTVLPDCASLTRAAFDRTAAARVASATGEQSVFDTKRHLTDPGTGPFRSFADVYTPTPLGYLEWLYRREEGRNTARFREMKSLFTVASTNCTWPTGAPPKHVMSWSLFLPRVPLYAGPYSSAGAARGALRVRSSAGGGAFGWRIPPDDRFEAKANVRGGGNERAALMQRYGAPMIAMIAHAEAKLGAEWGVVVHLGHSLAWLAPKLLAAGSRIEVSVMVGDGIRTAGSMWRWLPFDDTRFETVLALDADQSPKDSSAFQLWPAVDAFIAARGATRTSSMMRGYRGGSKKIATNAHIGDDTCAGCTNYATLLANFVAARPRLVTYSWRRAMIAFALHRVAHQGGAAQRGDYRAWPGALLRRTVFNAPVGEHTLGWGRALFSYGFDEYYLKAVAYFMHSADGSGVYSPIPANSFDPTDVGHGVVDNAFLRCRSAWFLDALWLATHHGNSASFLPTRDTIIDVDLESIRDMARECGLDQ